MKHILFALFAALLGLSPIAALAHGGGTPRVTGAQAGPYLAYVWSTPDPLTVGQVHFTIGVTLPAENGSETPVTDAEVYVTLQRAGPIGDAVKLAAEPGAGGGQFYEVDAELEVEGNWQANIEIYGEEGTGFLAFPVNVAPASSGQQRTLLITAGVLTVLVIGVVLLFGRSRRRPRATQK